VDESGERTGAVVSAGEKRGGKGRREKEGEQRKKSEKGKK
jgi:hypothetical protein